MVDRRSVWIVLTSLIVCLSIWRIAIQEPALLADDYVTHGDGQFGVNLAQTHLRLSLNADDRKTLSPATFGRGDGDGIIWNATGNKPNREMAVEMVATALQRHSAMDKRKLHSSLSALSALPGAINMWNTSNDDTSIAGNNNNETTMMIDPTSIESTANDRNSAHSSALPRNGNKGGGNDRQQSPWYHHLLLSHDFERLIDLHNFEFTMRQPLCASIVDTLIVVHSAPANFIKRRLIRNTWASRSQLEGTPLRLIFLLGAVANRTLQQRLLAENERYADMVQGNFVDAYKNITYKHVMAFKWFVYNCGHARLLVKVDDDIFMNTAQLLEYMTTTPPLPSPPPPPSSPLLPPPSLQSVSNSASDNIRRAAINATIFQQPKELLLCPPTWRQRVKRTYRSKWRVSFREYPNRYYPAYCSGSSIIYSADVAVRLYNAAQVAAYFWIDDVHVTGTLAHLVHVTITSALPYVLSRQKYMALMAAKAPLNSVEFLFTSPKISLPEIRKLWQLSHIKPSRIGRKENATAPASR